MILILIILIICSISIYFYVNRDTYNIKVSKDEDINIKSSIDLTGLPIVTLYQGDSKYNFILDTGSNINHIVNTCDIQIIPTDKIDHFYGCEGNTSCSPIVFADLYYKTHKYTCELRVSDLGQAFDKLKKESGVTVHGILGNQFLIDNQKILDFKNLIVHTAK